MGQTRCRSVLDEREQRLVADLIGHLHEADDRQLDELMVRCRTRLSDLQRDLIRDPDDPGLIAELAWMLVVKNEATRRRSIYDAVAAELDDL